MPYHIDEENSELAFEVREGNKLVIKIKSNIFSDSLELYLIKVGDNTEPTDKNVFSSLRVLKEIENLHDTILKEINSVTSGFWELKQDSQGNEYISTKYNVLTEGGLTTYGLGEQKLGTIYDGLPIDNDTIYWEEVEGSRVLKAKGSGGGSTGLDETKLWNVLGTPGDQQIDYSHLRSAFSQFSNEFVTINTEQEITALKHFTAGLSIGSAKKKIYEKDGVLYIDSNVAITGALTMYATDGQSVSSIYDGLPIDNDTIYWETVEGSRVLKAKGSGGEAGSVQWGNISGKPTWIEDTKPTYNWYEIQGEKPFYTKEEVAEKFVTIDTEQEITALKHFTAGLSVGESKKKIYEENGVVYIDADVAVTGAMTFYATAGRTVSTIMDAVAVDGITITKEGNVLKAVSGSGSNFDKSAMWNALAGSTTEQINKTHLTTALDNYPTKTGSGASGTWSIGITGNAGSASKLQTTHTIWGKDFNGTQNVSGEISDCTRIRNSKDNSLYLGNSDNTGWVYTQDIASHNGVENWAIGITGTAWFKNVNIGYAHPATDNYSLNVNGVISGYAYTGRNIRIECDNAGNNLEARSSEINNYNGKLYLQHDTSQDLICCKGGGNVGIGVDRPTYSLQVVGTIYTDGLVSAYGYSGNHIRIECDNNGGNRDQRIDEINNYTAPLYLQHNTGNNLLCCNGGGNVGIGTTSPAAKLDVNGDIFCISIESNYTSTANEEFSIDRSNLWCKAVPVIPNYKYRYVLGWQDRMAGGWTTGYGIGTYRSNDGSWGSMTFEVCQYETSQTRKAQLEIRGRDNILWFSGDILAEGGGTFYGSDIRYKTIVQHVQLLSLNKIAEAPSFLYRWNRPNMNQNRLNLGGSAQYTQLLLPWAVEDNSNFLMMDYATVAYTFSVHTARHLLNFETKTEKKIKDLEREIKLLKKQLKKLGYEKASIMDDQSV